MVDSNVVVVRFRESSKAYEALSRLKDCDAQGRIGIESAVVVERSAGGALRVSDGADNLGPIGLASGSVVGMLVGVLGGPLGVMLGWGAGALIGGAFDANRVVQSDEALSVLSRAIPPGSTAVITSVTEPATEVIDGEMAALGGHVTRYPVADVLAELEVVEEAADAAAKEARRTVRTQRKAKVRATVEEKAANAKKKLHA
ncbi:MAG TPA: DUF1269 domain-containing protein [Candidatus Limnocylindrales bacterium]